MSRVDRWLLPDGIEEVLPTEAAQIELARRQLLDVFTSWGYELVITPHIEFLDSLLTGAGQDLELQTFKVTDPLSGRLMGLRADITPQVTRIDAHTLRREGPSRLCYVGSVLHSKPRALSTSRSPIQLGAELYGDASYASDLEVIGLMLATLTQMQVEQVHLELGHVGIYRALVAEAGLSGDSELQLFDALQRKDGDAVKQLTADVAAPLAGMLQALVGLCGGVVVLDQAEALLAQAPQAVQQALADVRQVANLLTERFPSLPLYFDLGELRGYHYHTGMVFAAYVPGCGQAIAQGGRYDNIGADFGRARPATGFSTDLKTLVSLGQVRQPTKVGAIWAPATTSATLWQQISQLRAAGECVVQALPGQAVQAARTAGCDRQLTEQAGQWQLLPLTE
ncbi:ATP phosphoribosyltransferase regulatory subunit [Atopomonas sediminilitoris]|uniref:ATP phosphoribosyltransferase regulatory subunit n=1 Tax=Atopomonas sediminilitoris TaxID=2919919 RepID=UPI001F4DB549|nr:ATP phosphoribosyltransferase regulatory subunit [Atopomonas sediminilitoris]MCJ8170242.1 ATP phosphoribosyltransferase regulatory subunit [Atopomonas sediminilitoris]